MKKTILSSLVALALGVPLLAQAAEGWVVDDITLQAGPDMDFPAIADLEAGTPVSIQGCIDGWRWCDVIVEQDRGWVPGSYLEEELGGRPVVVIDSGPRIGIPIVSFSLGTYWGRHYHNRPFYSERQRFESHAIAAHAPPRPARIAATAPRHDVHVRARTDFAAQVRGNTQGQDRNASASTATTMHDTSGDNRTATRDHTRAGTAAMAGSATAQQSGAAATADRKARTVNRETPNYHRRADEKTDTQTAQRSAPRHDESQTPSPTDTPRRERPVAQQPQREPPEQKPPTNVAQADHPRHESGRKTEREQPKPKDELKKPNPKHAGDQNDDKDNGGG